VSDEGQNIAAELRRVAEEAHPEALRGGVAAAAPPPLRARQTPPSTPEPPPEPVPAPPDPAAVNAGWRAEAPRPPGVAGLVHRVFERIVGPRLEAQRAFNARLVQLHNETLRYLDQRFAATQRHYDRALDRHGRRMDEIDERHLILQEELVAHVHDLVKRIDLVLAEGERGRLSLEFALRDLRNRLARLEERLPRG